MPCKQNPSWHFTDSPKPQQAVESMSIKHRVAILKNSDFLYFRVARFERMECELNQFMFDSLPNIDLGM